LAVPARQRGFKRWGVKQVRWSGAHAVTLRWLYPRCQFLLIVRHPVMAYLSLGKSGFQPQAAVAPIRWPDRWVSTLDDFARMWNEMALSWWSVRETLGVNWLRYEDLVEGRVDMDAIGATIGLQLRSELALSSRAGAGLLEVALSPVERDRINELTAEGRSLFAYAE
jgi:hypothetical protein